eukprot:UN04124
MSNFRHNLITFVSLALLYLGSGLFLDLLNLLLKIIVDLILPLLTSLVFSSSESCQEIFSFFSSNTSRVLVDLLIAFSVLSSRPHLLLDLFSRLFLILSLIS